MIDEKCLREYELFIPEATCFKWKRINFAQLETGDVFRWREPCGPDEGSSWSEPMRVTGMPAVNCEPVQMSEQILFSHPPKTYPAEDEATA